MLSKRIYHFHRLAEIIVIIILANSAFSPVELNCQDKFGLLNLIDNGDFEQGNVDFTSGLIYVPDIIGQQNELYSIGRYSISTTPNEVHNVQPSCADHTTGSGLQMIINPNDSSDIYEFYIWSQTIRNIRPNTLYSFSFWFVKTFIDNPAMLAVLFNNKEISDTIVLDKRVCEWDEFTFVWDSGENSSLKITIVDYETEAFGNDFALDDFALYGECSLGLTPLPDMTVCFNTDTILSIGAINGVLPYSYEWFPKTGLSDYYSPAPVATVTSDITYTVKVADGYGCEIYDTLNITTIDVPEFEIVSDRGTTVCPCEDITLTAPHGYEYLWSDGSTSRTIVVSDSGKYSVSIYNNIECPGYSEIRIDYYEAETMLSISNSAGETGDTIRVPIEIISQINPGDCELGGYKAKITFNKSLLTPTGLTYDGVINGDFLTIDIEGNSLDNLLTELKFITTFGNAECTDIVIDEFDWDCPGTTIATETGRFCLVDICKSAGIRLFSDNGRLFLNSGYPNPAADISNIEFGIIEEAPSNLYLMNSLGERIIDILSGFDQPGEYAFSINLTDLANGIYFYVLETPTAVLTQTMVVAK